MATYAASEAVVGPRDFARVINNIFLSLNFIGRVKKKRNDVTEIVSELEIADVIFRRYDRKYVCFSQATNFAVPAQKSFYETKSFGCTTKRFLLFTLANLAVSLSGFIFSTFLVKFLLQREQIK